MKFQIKISIQDFKKNFEKYLNFCLKNYNKFLKIFEIIRPIDTNALK